MRIGRLDTRADIVLLNADLCTTVFSWVWVGITTKESVDVPAAAGLRSPAKVEVRAWWDVNLQRGRYLRTDGRLLLIDDVRDWRGDRGELVLTCSELVGHRGHYRRSDGVPVDCRVHLTHSAPYLDDLGQVTDYKTRAEVALIETGRPQVDDQLQVGADLYIVIGYASDSDDGVVRGLWLDRVA